MFIGVGTKKAKYGVGISSTWCQAGGLQDRGGPQAASLSCMHSPEREGSWDHVARGEGTVPLSEVRSFHGGALQATLQD